MHLNYLQIINIWLFIFQTVFELNPTQKSIQNQVMKNKRLAHGSIIDNFQKTQQQIESERLITASEIVSQFV